MMVVNYKTQIIQILITLSEIKHYILCDDINGDLDPLSINDGST